jgi:hypothetical protein
MRNKESPLFNIHEKKRFSFSPSIAATHTQNASSAHFYVLKLNLFNPHSIHRVFLRIHFMLSLDGPSKRDIIASIASKSIETKIARKCHVEKKF